MHIYDTFRFGMRKEASGPRNPGDSVLRGPSEGMITFSYIARGSGNLNLEIINQNNLFTISAVCIFHYL